MKATRPRPPLYVPPLVFAGALFVTTIATLATWKLSGGDAFATVTAACVGLGVSCIAALLSFAAIMRETP